MNDHPFSIIFLSVSYSYPVKIFGLGRYNTGFPIIDARLLNPQGIVSELVIESNSELVSM